MQIVSRKNFLLLLAALCVVLLGYMALNLAQQRSRKHTPLTETDKEIQQIQSQSSSDEIEDIEKDLIDTDLIDIDRELQDIEDELEATY